MRPDAAHLRQILFRSRRCRVVSRYVAVFKNDAPTVDGLPDSASIRWFDAAPTSQTKANTIQIGHIDPTVFHPFKNPQTPQILEKTGRSSPPVLRRQPVSRDGRRIVQLLPPPFFNQGKFTRHVQACQRVAQRLCPGVILGYFRNSDLRRLLHAAFDALVVQRQIVYRVLLQGIFCSRPYRYQKRPGRSLPASVG